MRCPRRNENPQADEQFPEPDRYEHSRCDYCGSVEPDLFMQRCEEGSVTLGATDKDYKVYVTPAGGTEPLTSAKFYFQHLTTQQMERFIQLYNLGKLSFDEPINGFYVLPFFAKPAKHSVH